MEDSPKDKHSPEWINHIPKDKMHHFPKGNIPWNKGMKGYGQKWSCTQNERVFHDMKQRCYNCNYQAYKYYGAKGIGICEEWMENPLSFDSWYEERKFPKCQVDRINPAMGYSPENCRVVTKSENVKRTSRCHFIDIDGEVLSLRDWAKKIGMSNSILSYHRKRKGDEYIKEYIKQRLEVNGYE